MPASPRSRHAFATIVMAAGAILFAISLAVTALAYSRAFGDVPSQWSIATGLHAVFIDTLLFALFAAHHSLFARASIRRQVSTIVSDDLERPVYVVAASGLLLLVVALWVPVPGIAWTAEGAGGMVLSAVQVAGLALTLLAAAQLGIRRLSGLTSRRPEDEGPRALRATGLYGFVRHPIYFAWLLMVWPVAEMTGSRLTFAIVSTIYLALAVPFEERTLRVQFGPAYDDYRRQVRWRMLPGVY